MTRPSERDSARRLRRELLAARSGPRIMTASTTPDNEFYGWQVLMLGSRSPGSATSESRAIYANLGDQQQAEQERGILRAVNVRDQAMRAAGLYTAQKMQIVGLPARFVWVDLADVRRWIHVFAGLAVPVGEATVETHDAGRAFRSVRVDLAWHAQVFEKHWQSRDALHRELNHHWESVWSMIERTLEASPQITDLSSVHEGWLLPEEPMSIEYDLSAFRIDSHSSS